MAAVSSRSPFGIGTGAVSAKAPSALSAKAGEPKNCVCKNGTPVADGCPRPARTRDRRGLKAGAAAVVPRGRRGGVAGRALPNTNGRRRRRVPGARGGARAPSIAVAPQVRVPRAIRAKLATRATASPSKQTSSANFRADPSGRTNFRADPSGRTLVEFRRARAADHRPERAVDANWTQLRCVRGPDDYCCVCKHGTAVSPKDCPRRARDSRRSSRGGGLLRVTSAMCRDCDARLIQGWDLAHTASSQVIFQLPRQKATQRSKRVLLATAATTPPHHSLATTCARPAQRRFLRRRSRERAYIDPSRDERRISRERAYIDPRWRGRLSNAQVRERRLPLRPRDSRRREAKPVRGGGRKTSVRELRRRFPPGRQRWRGKVRVPAGF